MPLAIQTPVCRLLPSRSATVVPKPCHQRSRRCRQAFTCRAKQVNAGTAEQSKKAQPAKGKTEKEADDQATKAKEEAEAQGENVEVEKQGNEIKVIKEGGEQIYIGFDKGAKTKDGKGRIIEDDPSRYPDRTQTTGGWAGGEQGLAAFIEEEQKKSSAGQAVVPKDQEEAKKEGGQPRVISKDGDTIYIGFGKGNKSGEGSAYVQDDPRRYPGKENLGGFSGVTGGFAGGEAGLHQFVDEGEIKFREADSGKNFNILAFAGLLAIATTVGGVLLTDAIDLGESGVKEGVSGATAQLAQLTSAPDSGTNTKLLLEVVVVLFGVTALAVGVRTAFKNIRGKVTKGSLNIAKLAIFWAGVFVAARYILESN